MEEKDILFEQPCTRSTWTKLKILYKKEFGKKYDGNCMCNAPKLQEILRKKKGYVENTNI